MMVERRDRRRDGGRRQPERARSSIDREKSGARRRTRVRVDVIALTDRSTYAGRTPSSPLSCCRPAGRRHRLGLRRRGQPRPFRSMARDRARHRSRRHAIIFTLTSFSLQFSAATGLRRVSEERRFRARRTSEPAAPSAPAPTAPPRRSRRGEEQTCAGAFRGGRWAAGRLPGCGRGMFGRGRSSTDGATAASSSADAAYATPSSTRCSETSRASSRRSPATAPTNESETRSIRAAHLRQGPPTPSATSRSREFSRDCRDLTFGCGGGVTWQGRRPLTADEVVFTMADHRGCKDPRRTKSGYALVESVRRGPGRRARFHYSQPFAKATHETGHGAAAQHAL